MRLRGVVVVAAAVFCSVVVCVMGQNGKQNSREIVHVMVTCKSLWS